MVCSGDHFAADKKPHESQFYCGELYKDLSAWLTITDMNNLYPDATQ